jgi:hypothetical protein
MSLDYPFYEELCRRKHCGAKWWMIGDRLYYLGLLPAMLAVPGAGIALIVGLVGRGWGWLLVSAVAFVVGTLVFMAGGSLKRHAYRLAERDGISAVEVYNRSTRGDGTSQDVPP